MASATEVSASAVGGGGNFARVSWPGKSSPLFVHVLFGFKKSQWWETSASKDTWRYFISGGGKLVFQE